MNKLTTLRWTLPAVVILTVVVVAIVAVALVAHVHVPGMTAYGWPI